MASSRKKKPGSTRADPATVAMRVAEILRDDIIRGVLAGGERLSEVALAKRYGFSRIPIREALRIVEGHGLIEIRPFTGAIVSELSPDDIVDIFEVHEALEAVALRLALPRLTSQDLDAAEQLARKAEREPDPHRWAELAGELYAVLYGGIGRRHLLDMLARVVTNHRRYLYAFFSALRTHRPDLPRPRDFVAVLRKKDVVAALAFQQAWRRAQRDFFIQHITAGSDPPPISAPSKKHAARGKNARPAGKRRSRPRQS